MFEYSKLTGVGLYPGFGITFNTGTDQGFGNRAQEIVIAMGHGDPVVVTPDNYGLSSGFITSTGSFYEGGRLHFHVFLGIRLSDNKPMVVLTFSVSSPQTPQYDYLLGMRLIGMYSFDVEGLTPGGNFRIDGVFGELISSFAQGSWFPFNHLFITVSSDASTCTVATNQDPGFIGPITWTEIENSNLVWTSLSIKSDEAVQDVISSPEVANYIKETTLNTVNPVIDSLDNLYVSA